VRRTLALLVAGAGAAAVLPLAPATAYCNEAHPCETTCDKVAATFDSVAGQVPGAPQYRDLSHCPQN
jgi:hypothetical protein